MTPRAIAPVCRATFLCVLIFVFVGCYGTESLFTTIEEIAAAEEGKVADDDTTPPADVSNLQAIPGDGLVVLAWDDPTDTDLDHIEISWSPGSSAVRTVLEGTETYTADNLTNGTNYTFTVVAVDDSDNESGGEIIGATPAVATGPDNVSNLEATPGDGEVVLTWDDPGDTDLDHIEITWSPGGTTAQTVAAGAETYTAGGLSNGTAYSFTVVTVDTSDNKSVGVVTNGTPVDMTGPANVSNLEATPGDGEVVLTWDDPGDTDLDHIEITWSPGGATAQTVAAGAETYTVGGLSNGTEYAFTVVAVDGENNESSGAVTHATPADLIPPAKVTNLQAVPGSGKVVLLWDDPVDEDFNHVEITWSPGGSTVQIIWPGTETYTAESLANETEYTFSVVTVDNVDNKSEGAAINATPAVSVGPDNVSNLEATPGDGEVVLTWDDPGDTDLDHIEITWSPGGTTVQTVAAGTETYTAGELTNYTEYTFTVVTVDIADNASGGVVTSETPVDMTGPANVSNLQAAPGYNEVVLTWNDPEDTDLDHVEITWTPDGSTAQVVESGIRTYTADGLTNGTTYTFTVISIDTNSNPSTGTNVSAAPGANAVTFLVDLPDQPAITFSGQQLILAYESDMTVTIVDTDADSVVWYLDGSAVATGLSITLGAALGTGPYELTAVVEIDDAYYSESIVFTVESSL